MAKATEKPKDTAVVPEAQPASSGPAVLKGAGTYKATKRGSRRQPLDVREDVDGRDFTVKTIEESPREFRVNGVCDESEAIRIVKRHIKMGPKGRCRATPA